MASTILHGVNPEQLQKIIETAIDKKLKPPPEAKLIPKNKAAKRLHKTVQTLDAWHRAKILTKKYIGGRVFYAEQDIFRLETSIDR